MADLHVRQDPRFVMGELVEIRDKDSALYGKRFRVQRADYKTWQDPVNRKKWTRERWKYKLPVACQGGFSFYWEEHDLIKLHANEECEWVDCLWQPKGQFAPGEDDEGED